MNQDALKILAKELTGEQFKVLMLMLADLDYENFIQIAQADIADALEMQKTHVSRAVRALLDVGVIWGLTLSGTKTHVKQRFLPLTPLLMVSDDLWSPVLPA